MPYILEVISIEVYLASDAMRHRGLRHLHRNERFHRVRRDLQLNREKLY